MRENSITKWQTTNQAGKCRARDSWSCPRLKQQAWERARSEEESKAAVSPSWLPGWGGLQRGWPSSRRVSKFLTSEAEIETEIATDTGLATAAKLSNSEALSPVSVPVTSSSDPQRTRHGFPPAPPQSSSLWTGGKRDVSHVLPD